MSYTVSITKTITGEVRQYREDREWDATDEYMWVDGNYSCDCNRELFFARAAGEFEPEDTVCDDFAYRVVIADDKTGKILFKNKPWYWRHGSSVPRDGSTIHALSPPHDGVWRLRWETRESCAGTFQDIDKRPALAFPFAPTWWWFEEDEAA